MSSDVHTHTNNVHTWVCIIRIFFSSVSWEDREAVTRYSAPGFSSEGNLGSMEKLPIWGWVGKMQVEPGTFYSARKLRECLERKKGIWGRGWCQKDRGSVPDRQSGNHWSKKIINSSIELLVVLVFITQKNKVNIHEYILIIHNWLNK